MLYRCRLSLSDYVNCTPMDQRELLYKVSLSSTVVGEAQQDLSLMMFFSNALAHTRSLPMFAASWDTECCMFATLHIYSDLHAW